MLPHIFWNRRLQPARAHNIIVRFQTVVRKHDGRTGQRRRTQQHGHDHQRFWRRRRLFQCSLRRATRRDRTITISHFRREVLQYFQLRICRCHLLNQHCEVRRACRQQNDILFGVHGGFELKRRFSWNWATLLIRAILLLAAPPRWLGWELGECCLGDPRATPL